MKLLRNSKGGTEIFLVILVIMISVFLAGGLITRNTTDLTTSNPKTVIPDLSNNSLQAGSTLQLQSFKGTIVQNPAPTPPTQPEPGIDTPACNHDNGQPVIVNSGQPVNPGELGPCSCPVLLVRCEAQRCVEIYQSFPDQHPSTRVCNWVHDMWCGMPELAPADGTYCLGKPVIYLYPEKPTFVDVKIKTPGFIYISDPLYENGWENVLAHPDSSLLYKNKKYNELYYETSVSDVKGPRNGIVIRSEEKRQTLIELTTRLGLIGREQAEFMEYWIPKLEELQTPYLFIGLIEKDEKERIDHVDIVPKPDTFIEMLFYFKPLNSPVSVEPVILPSTPPKRTGFTAVEWGGTIAR